VIFLARLQAMGYSGASADVVPSGGNGEGFKGSRVGSRRERRRQDDS
jgi:hypothetical protein